jgi:hypothetical protein
MYDINNTSNYKTEFKSNIYGFNDINLNSFEMNGEKFSKKLRYNEYEQYIEEQEQKTGFKKIKRLVKMDI